MCGIKILMFFQYFILITETFRKMTCYITQDDRLQLLLTVMENMRIACDFKLGTNVPKHEKEGRVSFNYIFHIRVEIFLIPIL